MFPVSTYAKEGNMDYYIDILIKPDSEMRLNVLLNTVYTKLHKILHDSQSVNIGISFPKYEITLGNVLRIHGDDSVLKNLHGFDWLGGIKGYCQVSEIKPIPVEVKFRTVSRKQSTMSPSKLRRLVKRGSISEDDVSEYRAKMFKKGLDNPYVELMSGSNGHRHRRYIDFGPLLERPVTGDFDQFGLSKSATIPWF